MLMEAQVFRKMNITSVATRKKAGRDEEKL